MPMLGTSPAAQPVLVGVAAGGEAVGEVAAGQGGAARPALGHAPQALEIGGAAGGAAAPGCGG